VALFSTAVLTKTQKAYGRQRARLQRQAYLTDITVHKNNWNHEYLMTGTEMNLYVVSLFILHLVPPLKIESNDT